MESILAEGTDAMIPELDPKTYTNHMHSWRDAFFKLVRLDLREDPLEGRLQNG